MKKENKIIIWMKNHKILTGIIGLILFSQILSTLTPSMSDEEYLKIKEERELNKQLEIQIEENEIERILKASDSQLNKINYGLINGINISNVYTIKSKDFENMYFIGGLLNGDEINNEIGIWIVGGYEETTLIFSINGIAYQFTGYGKGSDLKEPITKFNEGYYILEEYLENLK